MSRSSLLVGAAILTALVSACSSSEVATADRTIPAKCQTAVPVTTSTPPGSNVPGSDVPGSVPPASETTTTSTTTAPDPAAPSSTTASTIATPEGLTKPVVEMPGAPATELVKTDIVVGTGEEAKEGQELTVHYVGVACSSGKEFDASWDKGSGPVKMELANVIQGWQQGIPGMKVGGRRLLVIPPGLGYGSSPPKGSGIASNETLVFVVDLIGVAPAPTTTTVPVTEPASTDPGATSTTAPGASETTTSTAAPTAGTTSTAPTP